MKIGERIASLEADLLSKRDALTALTNAEELDEAQTAQFGHAWTSAELTPVEIVTGAAPRGRGPR